MMAGKIFHREKTWVCVLLLLFTVTCLFSIWNNSLTYDEEDHLLFGRDTLLGNLEHANAQRMPVTALNALPLLMVQQSDVSALDQETIWFCRVPTVVFAILLGLFIFVWSKSLYGVFGGVFSLFCYVFCPNIIAHAGVATSDLYCCFFLFLSLYAFRKYVEQKSMGRLLVLSVAVGLAQLTKQTALLLFPILFVLSMFEVFLRFKKNHPFSFKKYALHAVLFAGIVVFIINLGYLFQGSFMSLNDYREYFERENISRLSTVLPAREGAVLSACNTVPIPLPRAYVESFIVGEYVNVTGEGHGPVYLLGELSQFGHWYYFLVAFFLKTPIATIILISIALWSTLKSKRFSLATDETALLSAAGIIFLFFSFFTTAQIGLRYILPVYPFLYVLAGKIMLARGPMARSMKFITAGLSLYLIVSSLSYYPHYISYFNELCWDRTRLYRYLADSNLDWGQDDRYLREYLRLHANENNIRVNPVFPTNGKVIANVNSLVGVSGDYRTYAWLRNNYRPVGHIAYSWLIYEIPD